MEVISQRLAQKYIRRELAVRSWIEAVLKLVLPAKEALCFSFQNGVLLCQFMKALNEGLIPWINVEPKTVFKIKENIFFFIGACEEIGVPRFMLPIFEDIYHQKNVIRVIECLERVGRITDQNPSFSGPSWKHYRKIQVNNYDVGQVREMQKLLTNCKSGYRLFRMEEMLPQTQNEESEDFRSEGEECDVEYEYEIRYEDDEYAEMSSQFKESPSVFVGDSSIAPNQASEKLTPTKSPLSIMSTPILPSRPPPPPIPPRVLPKPAKTPRPRSTDRPLSPPKILPPPEAPFVAPSPPVVIPNPSRAPRPLSTDRPLVPPRPAQVPRKMPNNDPLTPQSAESSNKKLPTLQSELLLPSDPYHTRPKSQQLESTKTQNFDLPQQSSSYLIPSKPKPTRPPPPPPIKRHFSPENPMHLKASRNIIRKSLLLSKDFFQLVATVSPEVIKGIIKLQARVRSHLAKHIYRTLVRDYAYRKKVMLEIWSTERDYVHSLDIIVNVFMKPLQDSEIISKKQLRSIFSDVEVIRNYNSTLFSFIEPRSKNWSPNQLLGDIFVMITGFLKSYTEYVSNYNTAINTLKECRNNSAFVSFLESCSRNPEVGNQQITSFLIKPIQRIPRYELLLTELVKHTQRDHPDYMNLVKALQEIKKVASYVDQKKTEAEAVSKVLEVQTRILDCRNIVEPHRRFVFEGKLIQLPQRKQRHVFLFNDLLLCARLSKTKKNALKFKCTIFLLHTHLQEVEAKSPLKYCFEIRNNDFNVALIKLAPSSLEEKEEWMSNFTKVYGYLNQKKIELEELERVDQHSPTDTITLRKSFLQSPRTPLRKSDAKKEAIRSLLPSPTSRKNVSKPVRPDSMAAPAVIHDNRTGRKIHSLAHPISISKKAFMQQEMSDPVKHDTKSGRPLGHKRSRSETRIKSPLENQEKTFSGTSLIAGSLSPRKTLTKSSTVAVRGTRELVLSKMIQKELEEKLLHLQLSSPNL